MTKRTYSLDEAAGILGLSKEALRKRIRRGSIDATKDEAGRWQVIIEDAGQAIGQDAGQDASSPLVKALQKQIDFLEKELERKDHILMALTQKIPQLEAPKEQEEERRSWWPFGR
jgi:predicted site-specific integrase-resolvase